MRGAEDPLDRGKQGGELVAGPRGISRLPGPVGEFVAGDQGVRVVGAEGVIIAVGVGDLAEQVAGGRVTAGRRRAGGLAPGQHVVAASLEQGQVPGQAAAAGLGIGGGLLQRQRQPAQFLSQGARRLLVRVTRPVHQEPRGGVNIEARHLDCLTLGPQRVAAGDQHPAIPSRRQKPLDLLRAGDVIEHQ